ncbi:MAG: hypothetical protein ABIP68_07155 [Ferruginibacter sp.]
MSNEELMKPRYKVMSEYPGGHLKVGEIIPFDYGKNDYDMSNNYKNYPTIFKKLKWYEERKTKDLPNYLKDAYIPESSEHHKVYKVDLYDLSDNTLILDGFPFTFHGSIHSKLPATEEEYNNYIKTKNTNSER